MDLLFFSFRKGKTPLASWILICLSTSLLILLIIFLVGVEKTTNDHLCKATSALIQYFLLATFTWMGMTAVNLFYMIMFPMHYHRKSHAKYFIRQSIAAWSMNVNSIIFSMQSVVSIYPVVNACDAVLEILPSCSPDLIGETSLCF